MVGEMAEKIDHVRLGIAAELSMIGYNVAPTAADVCLPISNAIRILFKIFENWRIDRISQAALLAVSRSTLARYRKGMLPHRIETIRRIEDLLVCELMLVVLFPGPNSLAWLVNNNREFQGMSPLDYATRHGTRDIRKYLEGRVYSG
jgi:hypothetical protein